MRLHTCQACPSRKSRCEARHCNIHSAQHMRIFPWHRHPKRATDPLVRRPWLHNGAIPLQGCRFPAIPPSCHRFADNSTTGLFPIPASRSAESPLRLPGRITRLVNCPASGRRFSILDGASRLPAELRSRSVPAHDCCSSKLTEPG